MTAALVQFTTFAFFISITPGPTNIVALTNGQRVGWRATLPFALRPSPWVPAAARPSSCCWFLSGWPAGC